MRQPAVDFSFNLKFDFLEDLDGFRLGDFLHTMDMSFIDMSTVDVDSGIVVAGLTCDDYCSQRTTCGSCAADSQCGWCADTATCTHTASVCPSPLLDTGCCPSCTAHTSCTTCLAEPGCGWAYDTATCHSGVGGEELCGAASPSWWLFTPADTNPTQCLACPGAVDGSNAAVDANQHPVAAFCSGHGTCEADATCTCDAFYAGLGCDVQCPGAPSNVCSGHGTCDAVSGECRCECGYSGTNCETSIGACGCDVDGGTTYCRIGGDCST